MSLPDIQKRMFRAITEPLTPAERMRPRGLDGRSMREEAEAIIKPNERLTSFQRLEIYNRQYWFRILGSFRDDFPGLRAVLGDRRFQQLAQAYLRDCPSRSHTLRNLGDRLEAWLIANPKHAGSHLPLALDMLKLEWANIEAFDAAELSPLTSDDLLDMGKGASSIKLRLQPYLKLIAVQYPVDDIRLAVKDGVTWTPAASNAVRPHRGKVVKHDFSGIEPQPIHIAVHRQENTIYYKRLDAEACRMLHALGLGCSLLQSIKLAFKDSYMPVEDRASYARDAFAHWTALGWLCRR